MKRTLLILLISFLFIKCSSNNNRVIIPLTKIKGYKPFHLIQKFCFENPLDSILINSISIPKINTKLSIRVFHTQPEQYYAYIYHKNIIDSIFFDRIISRSAINNSKLTSNFIDESILIAIGNLNDTTIVCFVDKNNNNKLNDEEPIYYKKYKNSDDEKNAINYLTPIEVECENYDGSIAKHIKIPLLLNPYKGSFQIGGTWAKQIFLAVNIYEHRSGFFHVQNSNYNIQLNNSNISTIYNYKNVNLVYSTKKDSIIENINPEEISYNIKDVINISGYDIRIDSIDYLGNNLFITKLGENKNPVGLRIGNKAPIIDGLDIYGNVFNLSNLKGKYVLIDFWGTWCKPCINEIPNLNFISNNFSKSKIAIISIALDANIDSVKKAINRYNMNWIHFFQSFDDKSKTIFTNKYKVRSFPSTFVLDTEGRILFRNLRGKKLLNKIDSLISNS